MNVASCKFPWLAAAALCLALASPSAEAKEGVHGIVIFRPFKGASDDLSKIVEYGKVEQHAQVVNFALPGSTRMNRLLRELVVAVAPYPDFTTMTLGFPADVEAVKINRSNLVTLTEKYSKTTALVAPVLVEIDAALARYEKGEVLIKGQWAPRPGSVTQTAGANYFKQLVIKEPDGSVKVYDEVVVEQIDITSIRIRHKTGTGIIPGELLPKELQERWKFGTKKPSS